MSDTFYLVWNPDRDMPKQRHVSIDDAKREARRLAALNSGQQFIVLAAVGRMLRDDIRWETYEMEIPF